MIGAIHKCLICQCWITLEALHYRSITTILIEKRNEITIFYWNLIKIYFYSFSFNFSVIGTCKPCMSKHFPFSCKLYWAPSARNMRKKCQDSSIKSVTIQAVSLAPQKMSRFRAALYFLHLWKNHISVLAYMVSGYLWLQSPWFN